MMITFLQALPKKTQQVSNGLMISALILKLTTLLTLTSIRFTLSAIKLALQTRYLTITMTCIVLKIQIEMSS